MTRAEAIDWSDLVFTGVVEELRKVNENGFKSIYSAKMRVTKFTKGTDSAIVYVQGLSYTSSCALDITSLTVGQSIEMAVVGKNGKYWGNYCMQSALTGQLEKSPLSLSERDRIMGSK